MHGTLLLRLWTAAALLLASTAVAAAEGVVESADHARHFDDAREYLPSVRRWSAEFDLPPALLLAVIHTESRFDPQARSRANAIGLMQIIPDLAGADAWDYLTGEQRAPSESELLDPDTNIRLGAAYLRMLQDHYWSHVDDPAAARVLVLASYNWGVGNVRRRLKRADALKLERLQAVLRERAPAETAAYLRLVRRRMQDYESLLVAEADKVAAQ